MLVKGAPGVYLPVHAGTWGWREVKQGQVDLLTRKYFDDPRTSRGSTSGGVFLFWADDTGDVASWLTEMSHTQTGALLTGCTGSWTRQDTALQNKKQRNMA